MQTFDRMRYWYTLLLARTPSERRSEAEVGREQVENRSRAGARRSKPPAPRATGAVTALLSEATALHRRGRLDEAEALYRQVLAVQPNHPDALYLFGLVRQARGDAAAALAALDRAIRLRRDIPAYHLAQAATLLACQAPRDAQESAQRALALDPGNAEAHNVLGNALLRLAECSAAIASYREAIALRPEYAEAWNNLGSALREAERSVEAERALREAVRLRPGYASALANLGLVLQDQARWPEALDCFDAALVAAPAHAVARGNRAMLLLLLGRLEEGFREYEWRWRMPDFATPSRPFAQPAWDGADLKGATLLVHAEQGLGSAIQFARFLSPASRRGGPVILECQRPLLRLFRESLAAPDGPLIDVVVKGEPLPAFDRQLPLMSLPTVLGTGLATIPAAIPYLRADPEEAQLWRDRLSGVPRPRVGLVWAGNPEHANDRNRSLPAKMMARLAMTGNASLFSLQVPARPQDLAVFPAGSLTDLAPDLPDFAATAAALTALDLVISVDTAVAHLAGALGRPTWLLLPHVPDWRWLLGRDDSPWYPGMRLFRQPAPGDWEEPVRRITPALRGWRIAESGVPGAGDAGAEDADAPFR
jgi:tetratricopeptide (TPR) repeat protein